MVDSTTIEYVVVKKRQGHALGFAIREALVTSLQMGHPVFLQVANNSFIEVDGVTAIEVIEGAGKVGTLPTTY